MIINRVRVGLLVIIFVPIWRNVVLVIVHSCVEKKITLLIIINTNNITKMVRSHYNINHRIHSIAQSSNWFYDYFVGRTHNIFIYNSYIENIIYLFVTWARH